MKMFLCSLIALTVLTLSAMNVYACDEIDCTYLEDNANFVSRSDVFYIPPEILTELLESDEFAHLLDSFEYMCDEFNIQLQILIEQFMQARFIYQDEIYLIDMYNIQCIFGHNFAFYRLLDLRGPFHVAVWDGRNNYHSLDCHVIIRNLDVCTRNNCTAADIRTVISNAIRHVGCRPGDRW